MISIVMPTSQRKERAIACVQRLAETTIGWDVEVIAVVDNDPATRDALIEMGITVDYADDFRGIPTCLNVGLALAKGDYIVLAADDLDWGDGWLDEAMRVMREFPNAQGLVGFWDGHNTHSATHYIVGREFLISHLGGVLGYPHYKYHATDSEASERAKIANRFVISLGSQVIHRHHVWGDREIDANDHRNGVHAHDDSVLYHERYQKGFPNDFEPVITS